MYIPQCKHSSAEIDTHGKWRCYWCKDPLTQEEVNRALIKILPAKPHLNLITDKG